MIKFIEKHEEEDDSVKLIAKIRIEDGEANFMVEGEDGEEWYICKITEEGKLYLYDFISDELGLQLDKDQRIKTTKV